MDIRYLKNIDNIEVINEEKFAIVRTISGTFFKKENINEQLEEKTQYYFANGKIVKSEKLSLKNNEKTLKAYIKDKCVSEIRLDGYGCIVAKDLRSYNYDGKLVCHESNFISKNIYESRDYQYDERYQCYRHKIYKNSILYANEENSYDSNNVLFHTKTCYVDGTQMRFIYHFNYFSQCYKIVNEDMDAIGRYKIKEYKYEYNNNGDRMSLETKSDNIVVVYKSEYKYDYFSNWVEQVSTCNGNIEYIYRRRIKYRLPDSNLITA